jgi:hypothetical protein
VIYGGKYKMTDKTYDKPMKYESADSFQKFTIFDNISPDKRTIKKAAEISLEKEGVSNDDETYETLLKKRVSAFENLSARWFWIERSLMHDTDKLTEQREKHKKEFEEINQVLIESFKLIIYSCKNRLEDLNDGIALKVNGEPYSLRSLILMTSDITLTLKTANEQIRLCYGLSTDNKNIKFDGEVNKKLNVTTNTLDMIKEVDEDLADLYEPNTEY